MNYRNLVGTRMKKARVAVPVTRPTLQALALPICQERATQKPTLICILLKICIL